MTTRTRQQHPLATRKKPAYPIQDPLREFLSNHNREMRLPVDYQRLNHYQEAMPIYDAEGQDTLWQTVIYDRQEMESLNRGLKYIYALLKAGGDLEVTKHLYIDRIDYCAFGNSNPFRIRVVNSYNENQDYYYIKKADASRVYGLELEHLLSPNRMHYLTYGNTLVEEHVVGIPGDIFISEWLYDKRFKIVRLAKELIKFNERCFIRLLGDMRPYNFVVEVTPDFEEVQIRIRAMDFDQQSYNERKNFYLPQYFKDNNPLVFYCLRHINTESALQYQREEQFLINRRRKASALRLSRLLDAMKVDTIAPPEKVSHLGRELAQHYSDKRFLECTTMGMIVAASLEINEEKISQSTSPIEFQLE